MQVLIDAGAKVNQRNKVGRHGADGRSTQWPRENSALSEAKGGDINNTGWSALHYAAVNGHTDVVRYLLDQGRTHWRHRNGSRR